MVLSSMSPLFVLWIIRCPVPSEYAVYFYVFCGLMIIVPIFVLWWRIRVIDKNSNKHDLIVDHARDHKDSIVVYLFTIMLPLYSVDMNTLPNLLATLAALSFIIFIFWYLNLHYMNILFIFKGYHIFTIVPPANGSIYSDNSSKVLIAKQHTLQSKKIRAYRLSNSVYIEL